MERESSKLSSQLDGGCHRNEIKSQKGDHDEVVNNDNHQSQQLKADKRDCLPGELQQQEESSPYPRVAPSEKTVDSIDAAMKRPQSGRHLDERNNGHSNQTLMKRASGANQKKSSILNKGRVRIDDLKMMKKLGERWAVLTSYDVMSARIFDMAKIPCILVGDSAANVHMGLASTLPITMDEMILFTKAVSRGVERALVVADLPFGSYQCSPKQGLESAIRLMKEGGAHAVKLEGNSDYYDHVKLLTKSGVPVMAHVGFTPQFEHLLSGYRVQGRESGASQKILDDAVRLEEAGAFACVLEMVPQEVAKLVTERLTIPTVGIGAGPHCDAQVLVWQDMAGFVPPALATSDGAGGSSKFKVHKPKFVKRYADLGGQLLKAAQDFYEDVQQGTFPAEEHSFIL